MSSCRTVMLSHTPLPSGSHFVILSSTSNRPCWASIPTTVAVNCFPSRLLARTLGGRDSASIPAPIRGLMIAGDGWAALLQGDSVGGIRRMRYGLDLSAAPNEESAFPRLQLALALAARPETRAEGIRWLRYGFETLPLYKPLTLSGARPHVRGGRPARLGGDGVRAVSQVMG